MHSRFIGCMLLGVTLVLLTNKHLMVNGQECQVDGQQCNNHPDCCGGCCYQWKCVQSDGDCRDFQSADDPCLGKPCPGGLTCKVFSPNEPGSSRMRICV